MGRECRTRKLPSISEGAFFRFLSDPTALPPLWGKRGGGAQAPPSSAHPHHVPVRRFAKQPLILPVELRRALVADGQARTGGILAFREHEALGLVQAQPLVELQRAERRHFLKMAVERGGGHVHLLSQLVDLQRFPVIVPQPRDGLGDLIALGTEVFSRRYGIPEPMSRR